MSSNNRGFVGSFILLIVLAGFVVAGGLYYLAHQNSTSGWITSAAGGVTFSYPPNWTLEPPSKVQLFAVSLRIKDAHGNDTEVARVYGVLSKFDASVTPNFDVFVEKYTRGIHGDGITVTQNQQMTFNGKAAQRVSYTIVGGSTIRATTVYSTLLVDGGDNDVYILGDSSTPQELSATQPTAEQIIQSVKLP